MTLSDLGNVGEFVGAIAVILSLLYLAIQIRQNTRTVRAASHHAAVSTGNDLNTLLSEPENARIVLAGIAGLDSLSPEEQFRYTLLMRSVLAFYEDVFFQFREGQVDAEFWESRAQALLVGLESPGALEWWNENARFYHPAFRKAVATLLAA